MEANRYTLSSILKFNLSREEWSQIQPNVAVHNKRSILVVTSICLGMLFAMLIFSFLMPQSEAAAYLHVATFIILAVVRLAARHIPEDHRHAIHVLVYLILCIIFSYACLLGTVLNRDEIAVAYDVMIMAIPAFFISKPGRMARFVSFFTVVFICLAVLFDHQNVLWADLVNALVFSMLSIVATAYTNRINIQNVLYERELIRMSERDLLTGVHNRNSYEKMLSQYASRCEKTLGCIYVDMDGLHNLNNSKGHAAGDALLKCVAAAIQKEFGDADTFRIGGDEFIAFAIDMPEEEVRKKAAHLYEALKKQSYHASIGIEYAHRPDIDVQKLILSAEKEMYKSKWEYYQQAGIDRRKS